MRRVLDHDISMGSTEESIQAWKLDILKDRAKWITLKETYEQGGLSKKEMLKDRAKQITLKQATSKEACQRRKLHELTRLRREAYRHQAQRRN